MNTDELRQEIDRTVVANGQGMITARKMNKVLNDVADAIDDIPAGPQGPVGPVGPEGPEGPAGVNPFKGWFNSVSEFPTTGSSGDYLYLKGANPGDPAEVYAWDGTQFADTGRVADTSSVQTFRTGEEVNDVGIDSTHLADPISPDEINMPTIAKAEDALQLKAKLDGVTAGESKMASSKIIGIAVSGADGHIVNSINGITCKIEIPAGTKSLRFLGWDMVASPNVNNYGWCLGKQTVDGAPYLTDWTPLKFEKYSNTAVGSFAEKEYYVDEIPSDATTLLYTLKTGYIPELAYTYCYRRNGETVVELVMRNKVDVVDALDSTSINKALSARQGRVLNEKKLNAYYEVITQQNIDISSLLPSSWIYTTGIKNYSGFSVGVFPVEIGKEYGITGSFGQGSTAHLYCLLDSNQNFISGSSGYPNSSETKNKVVSTRVKIDDENAAFLAVQTKTSLLAIPKCSLISIENVYYEEKYLCPQEVNILCFGNSFTEDTMSYVPWILREASPRNIVFNIYFTYISGATLQRYLDYFDGNNTGVTLRYCEGYEPWASVSNPRFEEVISLKKWDLVTFQQGGNYNYRDYDQYFRPYINKLCNYIQTYANSGCKIGYIMSHASYVNTGGTMTFDQETAQLQARYLELAGNAEKVMQRTPIDFILPYATAIQNLRHCYLNELGGTGHLENDHIHLNDGLPCLTAAYANALAILKVYGCRSVFCNPVWPDSDFILEHNIQGSNNIVGLSEYNVRVAQACAELAVKFPFTATDINAVGLIGDFKVDFSGSNCSLSNPMLSAFSGQQWTAKVEAEEEFEVTNITVRMGGVDITSQAVAGTTVNIQAVTDDVEIVVTTQAV